MLAGAEAAQSAVIATLYRTGDAEPARRIQRCQDARTARRGTGGEGWPWRCRSAGGCWSCRRTAARRWWLGIRHWASEGGVPVSLAILPLPYGRGELRAAVARLRRICRDLRDRVARRRPLWRSAALAGMASSAGTAWLLVRHPGVTREELDGVLRWRWPDATVGDVGAVMPSWVLSIDDAVELAQARRGVEPLRVVVLPQRASVSSYFGGAREARTGQLEPMPLLL
jgi:hypothetical protein